MVALQLSSAGAQNQLRHLVREEWSQIPALDLVAHALSEYIRKKKNRRRNFGLAGPIRQEPLVKTRRSR